jgi:hypothetical protein
MLYIVEIPAADDILRGCLGQMQSRLDQSRSEPGSFRNSVAAGASVHHFDFYVEGEARACAQAFGGPVFCPAPSV